MNKKYLLLGGSGLIGYNLSKTLNGLYPGSVVCVSRNKVINELDGIDYLYGDINDSEFLDSILGRVDVVLDFTSTTMPNTNEKNLCAEIDFTLRHLDYMLNKLVKFGIDKFVYPSSGGAIYGDISEKIASETDDLFPLTPYGVGKKMAEEIIEYYSRVSGISALVFRIGNVYGSELFRNKKQGIIDVFIQNAILDEPITIWGNAENSIRDYIHVDDVSSAIALAIQNFKSGVNIYNISTGIGVSVKNIIQEIEYYFCDKLKVCYKENMSSGIRSIVLSPKKMLLDYNWYPKISLNDGILKTIINKSNLLNVKIDNVYKFKKN